VRVGILTQYYPPEIGAPQARLSDLAARLRDRGHTVTVLTAMPNYPVGRVADGYGGFFRREERDGVDVLRTWIWPSQSPSLLPRTLSYLSFTATAAAVGAWQLPRLDVLITESPPLPLGLTGFLLSRLRRARWIFNVSDLWPESPILLGVLNPGVGARLAYLVEAFCYRRAWRVSAQTEDIRADVERRFPAVRTLDFSGGADSDRFRPSHRDDALRESMFGDSPVVAVYAGLHGLAQALDQLLDAAALLRHRDDLTLAFIGDGPVRQELEAVKARNGLDNVRFLGPRSSSLMPSLLASADIAIVPVRKGMLAVPSKLFEAMASGIAVVVAAEGAVVDLIEATGAGVAVPPADAMALAHVLETLADSPETRKRMGAAGRRAAVDRYDRTVICDRFIDALEAAR
jgi:glycosyltransferase involved in cell wall biosynthesis